MEQWREVEMDTRYQVSSLGRVKGINGSMMKPCLDTNGYPQVKIANVNVLVHKLVCLAFVPNPNPNKYTEINHIDEVKLNNFYFNLEWCDRLHNIEHSKCYDFKVIDPNGVIHEGRNQTRFAREHGLHPRTFRKLINGSVHNHKGWRKVNADSSK